MSDRPQSARHTGTLTHVTTHTERQATHTTERRRLATVATPNEAANTNTGRVAPHSGPQNNKYHYSRDRPNSTAPTHTTLTQHPVIAHTNNAARSPTKRDIPPPCHPIKLITSQVDSLPPMQQRLNTKEKESAAHRHADQPTIADSQPSRDSTPQPVFSKVGLHPSFFALLGIPLH